MLTMSVEISKRLLVLFCGSCIFVYLLMLLYHPRSATTSDEPQFLHMDGNDKNLGLISRTYPDPSHPAMVLVLTYMRSGSSMTGDILQHSPEAFYVYEPFRSLDKKNTSTYTLIYANGTQRKPPITFQEETYGALYNWFTCNISKLSVIGLMDPFMTELLFKAPVFKKRRHQRKSKKGDIIAFFFIYNRGMKTRKFHPCYAKQIKILKKQTPAVQVCAKELQRICLDSPFRIIKTIRLQLHDIKNLLEDLPNLKIIHLVRDPRATLSSRAEIGWCANPNFHISCTNIYCKRLENDLVEGERLLKRYPNRIMTVFYEDIARQPLKAAEKMYDFIGANFTLEAQQYIYGITKAGKKDDCEICSTRSNSSKHIDAWKKTMNISFIKLVNERCNYVIKRYEFDEFPVLKEYQYMPII